MGLCGTMVKVERGARDHLSHCLVPEVPQGAPLVVQKSLRAVVTAIAEFRGSEVKELEVMADHVHLFIGAPPTESPVGIVKALKGVSARVLFDEHPILRTMFRQGHLWSPSYHIGTVGIVCLRQR